MADADVGNVIGHFVLGGQHDLAATVPSNHVIAASQEVAQVAQFILARQVQQGQVRHWLHNNLIKPNPPLQPYTSLHMPELRTLAVGSALMAANRAFLLAASYAQTHWLHLAFV
jgi:hypothetical protein